MLARLRFRLRRCIAGPFITDLEVSSRLFAVTHDAKLIITAGHWDNSFRVFNTRGKLLSRIVAHTGKNWESFSLLQKAYQVSFTPFTPSKSSLLAEIPVERGRGFGPLTFDL